MKNLPNVLTFLRIAILPVIIGLFYVPDSWAAWSALALYIFASITDYLDGHLARKWHVISPVGTFLDPIADKIFIVALLIVIAAFDRLEGIWLIPAILIIIREIFVSGLREFLGPKNVQLPVSKLAKWKTTVQMIALANHNVMTNIAGAAAPNQSNQSGVEIFVYGKKALNKASLPLTYPARQSFEASSAIARRHGLATPNYLLCQQSAQAINTGAFHNDVVCVTHGPVMLYHEQAFENLGEFKQQLIDKAEQKAFTPIFVQANQSELSLEDAVQSYIFNCQMVSLPGGDMALILPSDVQHNQAAYDFVQRILAADNPIKRAIYMDLRQSMRNGGGPACLRLRVPLSQVEFANMHQGVIMDAAKLDWLEAWVKRHYRDRLSPEDLSDPQLATESFEALDALTQFLDLGSLYDFQR